MRKHAVLLPYLILVATLHTHPVLAETREVQGKTNAEMGGTKEYIDNKIRKYNYLWDIYLDKLCSKSFGPGWKAVKGSVLLSGTDIYPGDMHDKAKQWCWGWKYCGDAIIKGTCKNSQAAADSDSSKPSNFQKTAGYDCNQAAAKLADYNKRSYVIIDKFTKLRNELSTIRKDIDAFDKEHKEQQENSMNPNTSDYRRYRVKRGIEITEKILPQMRKDAEPFIQEYNGFIQEMQSHSCSKWKQGHGWKEVYDPTPVD
jgi:hypothetical protein